MLNKHAYIRGDQSLINLSMGVVNSDTSDTRQSQKKVGMEEGQEGMEVGIGMCTGANR